MTLTNHTILITGGTRGIGFALAERLLARGNTVLITGRTDQAMDEAQTRLPAVRAYRCDVTRPAEIDELFRRVKDEHPALDVLVNNAGEMRRLNLLDAGVDQHDVVRELEVNLAGPLRLVQTFLPLLRGQKAAAIVNVTSGLAFVPFALSPVYSATKAGLHSYTMALRVQLKGTGIRVVEVAAPGTDTSLNDKFLADLGGMPLMKVPALIRAVEKGLEAGRSEIRPGLAKVLKWVGRLAPGLVIGKAS